MSYNKELIYTEKIKNHLINEEQKRQIEIHKWITSEQCGRDRGIEAIKEWILKYSKLFREWAESLPYECIECQCCDRPKKGEMCNQPFNEKRVKAIGNKKV